MDALVLIEDACPTAPQWSAVQLAGDLESERARLIVLEEGGRVEGFAALLVVPPGAEITSIVIRRESQGRGLGRALLAHVMEEARSLGCGRLSLEVSASNAAALALYASAGFKAVGRRPKYYDDGADAVLMDLDLAP
ncbi:MAG: ribosomal protein S18-alanine N-acetyltransferase [Elusimicrobia bacterium]|nr:ribosomal protein S18-alanine N-acetyltransferase [Elusimicrobiota bacterium]